MNQTPKRNRVLELTAAKSGPEIKRYRWNVAFILITSTIVIWIQGLVFRDLIKTNPLFTGIGIGLIIMSQVAAYGFVKNALYATYYRGIVSYLDAQLEVYKERTQVPDLKIVKEDTDDRST